MLSMDSCELTMHTDKISADNSLGLNYITRELQLEEKAFSRMHNRISYY